MNTRTFLFLGFLGLLAGCSTNPYCANPDAIAVKWAPQCFYHLTVTQTDRSNSTVTAHYADYFGPDPTKAKKTYTFRVRDLDHLKLETGKDYYFIRQGSSPFLEPFVEKPKCAYDFRKKQAYECPEY